MSPNGELAYRDLLRRIVRRWDQRRGSGETAGFPLPSDADEAMDRLEAMGFEPRRVFATRLYVAWNRKNRLFVEPVMERARAALETMTDDQ